MNRSTILLFMFGLSCLGCCPRHSPCPANAMVENKVIPDSVEPDEILDAYTDDRILKNVIKKCDAGGKYSNAYGEYFIVAPISLEEKIQLTSIVVSEIRKFPEVVQKLICPSDTGGVCYSKIFVNVDYGQHAGAPPSTFWFASDQYSYDMQVNVDAGTFNVEAETFPLSQKYSNDKKLSPGNYGVLVFQLSKYFYDNRPDSVAEYVVLHLSVDVITTITSNNSGNPKGEASTTNCGSPGYDFVVVKKEKSGPWMPWGIYHAHGINICGDIVTNRKESPFIVNGKEECWNHTDD